MYHISPVAPRPSLRPGEDMMSYYDMIYDGYTWTIIYNDDGDDDDDKHT